MNTPILDFARKYAESNPVRMHMPGHKGQGALGCEPFDLTEIIGADELFAPDGIIAESEANASRIFGCPTVYSTEGSSLCIRTMLFLALQFAAAHGKTPRIAATRNAHRSFLSAAILLDFQPIWLPASCGDGLLASTLDAARLAAFFAAADPLPSALYLTSPDYLGNMTDVRAISEVCRKYDVLLLVDNAHGAYLQFLPTAQHPAALGADLCCDSAHKTLPVLTGGAYLHMAGQHSDFFVSRAKSAMGLFASTSPSYLILESLDACNALLASSFSKQVQDMSASVPSVKAALAAKGYVFCGTEPLKLTICTKSYGYLGTEIAEYLNNCGIIHEFADRDHLVLMLSPHNTAQDTHRLCAALSALPQKPPICEDIPYPSEISVACTPRLAAFAPTEKLPISACNGRICAETAFSCPPAVPIVFCGEQINQSAIDCFRYYGIEECRVVCSSLSEMPQL